MGVAGPEAPHPVGDVAGLALDVLGPAAVEDAAVARKGANLSVARKGAIPYASRAVA